MSEERVEKVKDIARGRRDHAGERILGVFAYNPPNYAIYRTCRRLMIQFADDPATARLQRMRVSVLAPLRGQINGLIDKWRGDIDAPGQSGKDARRAERYDRRGSDAILLLLEDASQAMTAIRLLTEIKDDVVAERQSFGRVDYLFVALSMTIGFIALMWLASADWVGRFLERLGQPYSLIWTGVAGGALGAFLSIASTLKTRTVLINLRMVDNAADAALRVSIGAISGGVLICLFASKLVAAPLFAMNVHQWLHPTLEHALLMFMLGFLAGFTERLLPDLLEKAQLGLEQSVSVTPNLPPGKAARAAEAAAAAVAARTNLPPPAPAEDGSAEPPKDVVNPGIASASGVVGDPDAAVDGAGATESRREPVDDPDAVAPAEMADTNDTMPDDFDAAKGAMPSSSQVV